MGRETGGAMPDRGGAGLLYTQEFCLLLGRAQHAPIIRRELTGEYIPSGYDADQVWDALTMIRRSQAIVSPDTIRPHDGLPAVTFWHTYPESLLSSLRQISELTRRGSRLDGIVSERSGRRFVTQQYIEEACTNLRLDGFPADYEETREALVGDVLPAGDAQRLACNYHRIMCEMGDYRDAPLNAGLLNALYDRLTQGVSSPPAPSQRHSPLEPFYRMDRERDPEAAAEALATVVDIANDRVCEPVEDPVLVSMLVNCQFWHDPIFPMCNNQMGCIASRLYLYRRGFPVFRYVPKIHLLWSWRNGRGCEEGGYTFDESHQDNGLLGVDWTAYYDTVMRLMLEHVRQMEESLCARKAADEAALARVASSPRLNARQATVLRQAVLDPGREFRISWHRQEHGVVYSTARADLQGLVDLGLLACAKAGSAHVFRSVPGLAARLHIPDR